MINLPSVKEIAAELETALNSAAASSGLDNVEAGISYRFSIVPETGEYIHSDREGNKIETLIQGTLVLTESSTNGQPLANFNASMSFHLELCIPFITQKYDTDGASVLLEKVRDCLNSALGNNAFRTIETDTGNYMQGMTYNLPNTGERQGRANFGESIILPAELDFFFIYAGLNSRQITITYSESGQEDFTIPAEVLNEGRVSSQTGNVPVPSSNTYTAPQKHTTEATVYTLTVSGAVRLNAFDKRMDEYIHAGNIEPLTLTVTKPVYSLTQSGGDTSVSIEEESHTYRMVFASASYNGQKNLGASFTCTLVEALEV